MFLKQTSVRYQLLKYGEFMRDCNDAKWATSDLKSSTTRLFFQQLAQTNNKENIAVLYHWLCVRWRHRRPTDSLQKGPIVVQLLVLSYCHSDTNPNGNRNQCTSPSHKRTYTTVYTEIYTTVWKIPLFADLGREKHPFFNRNRWFRGPIKRPF